MIPHIEQHPPKVDKKPFSQDKLYYNNEEDCYYCPMGQVMQKTGIKEEKSEAGYKKQTHLYQAKNCKGCPLKGLCHQSKGNRTIQVNHRLNQLK